MARFRYKAVRGDGEVIEGEIEAISREAVIERLRGQGHMPIRADEFGVGTGLGLSLGNLFKKRRATAKDILLITQELAILLRAGLPLDRALSIVGALASRGTVKAMIERIHERVRGGATLAESLEIYQDVFPTYYSGMVRAGEAGGSLDVVLTRLAETLERSEALKDNVKSALQYPALVVIMAVLSMIILMTAVIPEFRPLFEEAGTDLPVSTQIVVAVSDFLGDYWWALAGGILLVMLLIRRHNADPAGRLRWDRWMLDAPMIGNLIKKIEVARLSRTLGTLLSNGVTVLNALSMTTEALGNQAVVEALDEVRGRLTKGERLADPLIEAGVFPPLALQLIQIGEESGKLEEMLLRVAEIYDDEVKRTIQRNLGLLVPLITIGVGILIAMIIGSILAAILSAYDLPF